MDVQTKALGEEVLESLTPDQQVIRIVRDELTELLGEPSKDLELNKTLESLVENQIQTRNATVFQGVLEHLHEEDPDMLCVIRRKRGFFQKLWQDDRVKKIDFDSNIPLLVLKGLS